MKKVIDVDSHGNAVKPKKNNKKNFGFKKKQAKDITAVVNKKPVRKIVEYYYFLQQDVTARELQKAAGEEWFEQADIWPELNLMEVVMNFDSLIFQDATECFVDSEDLAYFEAQGIRTKYQISYDTGDVDAVRKVMKNIMTAIGGVICSDTDDFEPMYTIDKLDGLA
jgi:hypothetical protein